MGTFVVTIAPNYSSEVKNCASGVFISNIRNPVPSAKAYSFKQNHCPDTASSAARRIRPAAASSPKGLIRPPCYALSRRRCEVSRRQKRRARTKYSREGHRALFFYACGFCRCSVCSGSQACLFATCGTDKDSFNGPQTVARTLPPTVSCDTLIECGERRTQNAVLSTGIRAAVRKA